LNFRTTQRRAVSAPRPGVKVPPLNEVADAARGDAEDLRRFRPGDPQLGLRRRGESRMEVERCGRGRLMCPRFTLTHEGTLLPNLDIRDASVK
jgi:hypothetical protein